MNKKKPNGFLELKVFKKERKKYFNIQKNTFLKERKREKKREKERERERKREREKEILF